MNGLVLTRWATLLGYFGLILLILIWHLWLARPDQIPVALVLAVLLIPLAFPMKGLLQGRAYTHAWTSFLALFYFIAGTWNVATQESRGYGTLLVFFSLLLFVGCVFYARWKGRMGA